jgi:hypothetical protein
VVHIPDPHPDPSPGPDGHLESTHA